MPDYALVCTGEYCSYRQLMGGVRIVQYFGSADKNLGWKAVHIRAAMPGAGCEEG